MIAIMPDKDGYLPCRVKLFSGIKTETYPSIFKGIAIVGYPNMKNGGLPNVIANRLVNKSILTRLFGNAYLFKMSTTMNDLQPFTEEEAEAVIKACIAVVNKPMDYSNEQRQQIIEEMEGAIK